MHNKISYYKFLVFLTLIASIFIYSSFIINIDRLFSQSSSVETKISNGLNPSTTPIEYYSNEWEQIWGGTEEEYGRGGIAIDSSGYIYIAGSTYSFGSGAYDACIIKYSPEGNQIWNMTWGDDQHQNPYDIAVGSSGNIYVTGEYKDLYGVPSDIFLLKLNSDGNYLWHRRWGPSSWNEGYGIAIDDNENIYITGRTDDDFALLKYNYNGNQIWTKINTTLQGGQDIVCGDSGTIYTTGNDVSTNQIYISKYWDNGTMIWHRYWGGSDLEETFDMAIDSSNSIYITGRTESYGAGLDDAFIVKYNSSGSLEWNTTWGTLLNDFGYGIALDENDSIYLTGKTEVIYDSGVVNLFITKFNSDGINVWNDTWGGYSIDLGDRIAVNSSGEIYLTGTTQSYSSGESDIFLLKFKPFKYTPPPSNLVIPGFEIMLVFFFVGLTIIGISWKLKKRI